MFREGRDLKARGLSVAPTRGLARKALGAGPGQCERTLGLYLNIHIGGAFPRVIVVESHHSSCGHRVTPATSSASLCKTIRSSCEEATQCPKSVCELLRSLAWEDGLSLQCLTLSLDCLPSQLHSPVSTIPRGLHEVGDLLPK